MLSNPTNNHRAQVTSISRNCQREFADFRVLSIATFGRERNAVLLGYAKKNVENYSEKNFIMVAAFSASRALSMYLWFIEFRSTVVYRAG